MVSHCCFLLSRHLIITAITLSNLGNRTKSWTQLAKSSRVTTDVRQRNMSDRTAFDFSRLIEWYQSHCDDDWEHQYGIKLETLDNPGWLLVIDLRGTALDGQTMEAIKEGITAEENPELPTWFHCSIRDNKFQGACDPTQIVRLFEEFERFRERCSHP